MRVCLEPNCPVLTHASRCERHTRDQDRARGTRQQRGYDASYDAQHKADQHAMASGAVLVCWRCGGVVLPHDYSLGHCDDDRSVTHGPEHLRQCNLANTRGGCPHLVHISPAALTPGGGGQCDSQEDRGGGASQFRALSSPSDIPPDA